MRTIKKIVKRDGRMVEYDVDKIAEAISILATGIYNCIKAFMALKPVQDLIEKIDLHYNGTVI